LESGKYFDLTSPVVATYLSSREYADRLAAQIELITPLVPEQGKAGAKKPPPKEPTFGVESPPAYTSPTPSTSLAAAVTSSSAAANVATVAPPPPSPPPPPTYVTAAATPSTSFASPPPPQHGSIQHVRALYDYIAEADGDLSFKEGDMIEILEKTGNVNDWWKGRLHGQVGLFPANYTEKL